jgi:hypothetical protein
MEVDKLPLLEELHNIMASTTGRVPNSHGAEGLNAPPRSVRYIAREAQASVHTIRCTFVAFNLTSVCGFLHGGLCLKIAA